MRIIGGKARGRKLLVPKKTEIRMTSDRVKESLFNILSPVEGITFLDLYAGTGNVGIEAISRKAKKVVFIEKSNLHVEILKKNIDLCGFNRDCEIIADTVKNGIRTLAVRQELFDIIFADPPYEKNMIRETLRLLSEYPLMAKNGIIVMEHSLKEECTGEGDFVVTDQRKYGDTGISFLKSSE
jgi:16S rRNA (guanine966-N2)-methyltransferase